jgi:hypothetical protein
MATVEEVHPHDTIQSVKYRFIFERLVNFGEALYIVGNIRQLG